MLALKLKTIDVTAIHIKPLYSNAGGSMFKVTLPFVKVEEDCNIVSFLHEVAKVI